MTSQFSPGKDLRKGNEDMECQKRAEDSGSVLSVKPFPITTRRTKLCLYLAQQTQHAHRLAQKQKLPRYFLQQDEFIHSYYKRLLSQ